MENFSPVSGSLSSLLDSLHSNPQRTTMHSCPACGCLRIVSRMYKSELRLLKFGPGVSIAEMQPPGSGLSGSTLDSEDRESCCCICHLHDAPERSSRCVSPIQSERGLSLFSDDDQEEKCEKHDNAFVAVDECCKCRSICTNLIQRVS